MGKEKAVAGGGTGRRRNLEPGYLLCRALGAISGFPAPCNVDSHLGFQQAPLAVSEGMTVNMVSLSLLG